MLLTENFEKMLISYFQNYPSGRPTLTSHLKIQNGPFGLSWLVTSRGTKRHGAHAVSLVFLKCLTPPRELAWKGLYQGIK